MAVIISNIGPFSPDILRGQSAYQWLRNRLLKALTIGSLNRADKVFLLSNEAHRLLGKDVPDSKVVFLPMSPPSPAVLDEARQRATSLPLPDVPLFVAVGDLYPYKGVEDVVLAISELIRRGREARLLICGHPMDVGYTKRLRLLAAELPPATVSLLGRRSRAEVLAIMQRSTATVICSRLENPNRVPAEAMSVASPMIAADVPVSREVCGPAAIYYPAGNAAALAGVMASLISDQGLRKQLAAIGKERIADLDWLSATRTMLKTLDLL